ncbi:MAG: hypothetical protein NTW14_01055 [bacterium]|nr:hypothetical protein [bacterium]
MKTKPVRIFDVSRLLRIPSNTLIAFLKGKGYDVIGDYFSPLTDKMVELIQNGYHDGPPFKELDPYLRLAEVWSDQNPALVEQMHKPPQAKAPSRKDDVVKEPVHRRPRKPKISFAPRQVSPYAYTGRIALEFIDLELIHQILTLEEEKKILIRDYFRRKTILKAISQLE